MKQKLLMALGILIGVSILGTTGAHALNAQSGDTMTISKNEVVDSTIFRAGKTITIAGTVKGDVFCAGQNIEITGTVEGDVLCAGQSVRVSGKVTGDVRVAGQNVVITGEIKGNLTAAGQNITLENSALIGNDATVAGQTTRVGGAVGRDVVVNGTLLTIAGKVGRNLDAYAEDLTLKPEARVQGDFTYTSEHQASQDAGAVITGRTEHKKSQPAQENRGNSFLKGMLSPLNWLLSILVIGGTFLLLLPRWFGTTTAAMRTKVPTTVGVGLLGIVLAPIVGILLMVTFFGIPLGIALLVLWAAGVFASFTFTAYSAGTWILTKLPWLEKGRELAALVLGALILVLLMHIPMLGFWVGFAALIWGFGGLFCGAGRAVHAQRTPLRPSVKKGTHA